MRLDHKGKIININESLTKNCASKRVQATEWRILLIITQLYAYNHICT